MEFFVGSWTKQVLLFNRLSNKKAAQLNEKMCAVPIPSFRFVYSADAAERGGSHMMTVKQHDD